MNRKRLTIYWSVGFILSFLFIWGVSTVFTNSIVPVVWDDAVQRFVTKPDAVIRVRSEGWAETRMGRHGLTQNGEKIFYSSSPKVLLWGDSFALGEQVPEEERIMGLFNSLAQDSPIRMVTTADSGLSVSDSYFYIPRYERLTKGIEAHVFLLAGMRSIMPGEHLDCHSRFLPDPWRFEESQCPPSETALRFASPIHASSLDFLHQVYTSLRNYSFRFSPGNMSVINPPKRQNSDSTNLGRLTEAWNFLLEALKKQTDQQLVFVYTPLKPDLNNGTINRKNPELKEKELFQNLCEQHEVAFVDLTNDFTALYDEKGKLGQGFFNTPQGYGHLNVDGQKIVAQGLHNYFSEGKQ